VEIAVNEHENSTPNLFCEGISEVVPRCYKCINVLRNEGKK
jgi:hypothetical protein